MAEHALDAAEYFLQPVLKQEEFVRAKSASVVDRLFDASGLRLEQGQTKQAVVVDRAISLLEVIHTSFSNDQALATKVLNTSNSRRLIDALLDLISLEGIYPCLLPGVGSPIERRVRSVIQGGITVTETSKDQNVRVGSLERITELLYDMTISGQGVALAIQQRTLVDLIAAMAQLAHDPGQVSENAWPDKLARLVDNLSPTILFPSLTSLIHSATPDWLKSQVMVPLSLLPMRPDGVRQTIVFVAKSAPQRGAQGTERGRGNADGPTLPIEVLKEVSKVLSAWPIAVSDEEYYTKVGGQLVKLLDDRDPDTQRAAAYTISYGILGNRLLGAPGKIGWRVLAEPFIMAINPSTSAKADAFPPSSDITEALRYLSSLLLTFKHPALSWRLLRHIVLPMWAIFCMASADSTDHNLTLKLFQHYMNEVRGSEPLTQLAAKLMYDGEATWKYSSSGTGVKENKMSIVAREEEFPTQLGINDLDKVQDRIGEFMSLFDQLQSDTEMSKFFAQLLRRMLLQPDDASQTDSNRILQPIIYATIARDLITTRSSRLMGNVSNIVSLMQEILSSQLTAVQTKGGSTKKAISKSDLAGIVGNRKENDRDEAIQDLENSLDVCLPWLALVVQTDSAGSKATNDLSITVLTDLLHKIVKEPRISKSTKQSITSILRLFNNTDSGQDMQAATPNDRDAQEVKLHADAMVNLQADEPPIRVQGLSQLESLISRDSPLVSPSSAVLTIMSLLQDPDSFVYLSAIKTLTRLAHQNTKPVVKTLQEAFQDITEQSTLDVRLRIGEVLQTIIEDLGPELPSSSIIALTELLLHLASRRLIRAKSTQTDPQATLLPKTHKQSHDSDSETELDEQTLRTERDLQTILDTWHGGKAGTEDQRIRASALALLGALFEHAPPTSTAPFINPTTHLLLRILQHERGGENALIRRAAVLVFLSIVNARRSADTTHSAEFLGDTGIHIDADVAVDSITTVIADIAVSDNDALVRGHAENVLRGLAEWKADVADSLLPGQDIRFGLADEGGNVRLRGLRVDPGLHSTVAAAGAERGKGRKVIIEEVE